MLLNHYLFYLLTIFLCLPLAAREPTKIEKAELTDLVEKWIITEVESDREGLSSILHEEFISTFSSGKTIDKKQYLDFIMSLDIAPFSVKNEFTYIHGKTAVVVDVGSSGKTKFTWIARKENQKWLVIAQTFNTIKK